MLKSLANSYTGLRAHRQLLDVTAHNLANVNTIAFRERQVSFRELPYRDLAERRLPVTGQSPLVPRSGRGVELSGIVPSCGKGALTFTGQGLDLAIEGEGYLRVVRPDCSYAFTRAGNFSLNAEGNMVTSKGARLDLSLDHFDNIDPSTLEIRPGGEIYACLFQAGSMERENHLSAEPVRVGELRLYNFTNPQGLSAIGENLLLPSAASGPPMEGRAGEEGFGEIRQGFLEGAGVDLSQQMVMLIRGQRALQASARTASAADDLWALTLNVQA